MPRLHALYDGIDPALKGRPQHVCPNYPHEFVPSQRRLLQKRDRGYLVVR